jgi:sugar lactone lactonase YvrE
VYSSTNQTPTIADSRTQDTLNFTNSGFVSRLKGLTPSTTYYLRAYATNAGGAGYGAVIKFTTNASGTGFVSTVSTVAGGSSYGYVDGTGTAALFNGPQALSYYNNNIYVMDAVNNAVRIMSTGGVVTSYTNPGLGYQDGALSSALFYGPRSIVFDAQGNGYIADMGNNLIRKITPAGVVSTFAGNGTYGYVDGSGSVVEFRSPSGLCIDASGNIYVADRGNNLIRKITSAGVVSTLAGYPPQVGGGPITGYFDGSGTTTYGTAALFNGPTSVAVDASGNVYVADHGNFSIRMITPAGVVSTLAGTPVQKYLIGTPITISIDSNGNLFVVDERGRILEITAAKVLYVLAGTANLTGYVDGAGTAALFNFPQGAVADASGNIYVSDFNNNVIRKVVVKFQ